MKYLKALLVIAIMACTFGSAIAQPVNHHRHHRHWHHPRRRHHDGH